MNKVQKFRASVPYESDSDDSPPAHPQRFRTRSNTHDESAMKFSFPVAAPGPFPSKEIPKVQESLGPVSITFPEPSGSQELKEMKEEKEKEKEKGTGTNPRMSKIRDQLAGIWKGCKEWTTVDWNVQQYIQQVPMKRWLKQGCVTILETLDEIFVNGLLSFGETIFPYICFLKSYAVSRRLLVFLSFVLLLFGWGIPLCTYLFLGSSIHYTSCERSPDFNQVAKQIWMGVLVCWLVCSKGIELGVPVLMQPSLREYTDFCLVLCLFLLLRNKIPNNTFLDNKNNKTNINFKDQTFQEEYKTINCTTNPQEFQSKQFPKQSPDESTM